MRTRRNQFFHETQKRPLLGRPGPRPLAGRRGTAMAFCGWPAAPAARAEGHSRGTCHSAAPHASLAHSPQAGCTSRHLSPRGVGAGSAGWRAASSRPTGLRRLPRSFCPVPSRPVLSRKHRFERYNLFLRKFSLGLERQFFETYL